jgi:hypothetical protein
LNISALRAEQPFYREAGNALAAWIAEDCAVMHAQPLATASPSPSAWDAAHSGDLAEDEARLLGLDDLVTT